MDVDILETVEQAQQESDRSKHRLNAAVAVSVALLATFMAICKVKDDNIVQGMQQAQADKLDYWGYYQARNIRQEVLETSVLQLQTQRVLATPAQQPALDVLIAKQQAAAVEQDRKKGELKNQAEGAQKQYDALNFHDDQFDLSDALLAIAIAMLAVTALTGLWWMYWLALVPSVFGVIMGLAGLTGSTWIHPDALIKLLS